MSRGSIIIVALVVALFATATANASLISCPPCTSCVNITCPKADPYVCTAGISKGGCAPTATTWGNPKMCTACCDATKCAPTPPGPPAPSPTENLKCPPCPSNICLTTFCSPTNPYQCTAGNSSGGCAATSKYWSNPALCTACCDISSCPQPTNAPGVTPAPGGKITCGTCTAAQCKSDACPVAIPFLCTGGRSKGGCASNGASWNNSALCTSCCDLAKCDKPPAPPSITCPPCNNTMCLLEECSPQDLYYCTAGSSKGGCAATSQWNPNECSACCDTAKCHTDKKLQSFKALVKKVRAGKAGGLFGRPGH